MKILIINTYDIGGAANSCLRLHQGLLESEVDSKVLLRNKTKKINKTIQFSPLSVKFSFFNKLKNKFIKISRELKLVKPQKISFENEFLLNRSNGLEAFSFPNSNFDITESIAYQEADIINLHWVANFLDYSSFFKKNTKPVVWTLHDMNPFTGGEHYLEEFLGVDTNGFQIKREMSAEEKAIAEENINLKIKALSKVSNLTIVAPSEWLAKEARNSQLFQNMPVFCIPYGLDSEIFSPRNKEYSRNLLNIPNDKKVILFVADFISNDRKGFVFLKKAFEQMEDDNVILCAIGNKNSELETLNNIIELGPVYDERLMSVVYSAADVFVIPSLMDNLPNTVLESLLCGTPVVGFPVGGILDMIEYGENGYLTKEISVLSLLDCLKDFLKGDVIFDSVQIRTNALKKYDLNVQASAYKELFTSILKK